MPQDVSPDAPLSDAYLKAHADDPDVVPYLTSDERRRMTRFQMVTSMTQRPIFDIGAGAALLGAQSEPSDVLAGALGAINPMNWLRGAVEAGRLAFNPSEIPAAATAAMQQTLEHPGVAAGGAIASAAIPHALNLVGSVRDATAPFAETLLTKKLGLDPAALDLQAVRLRLQAARSRTRQATKAAASEAPATPASSAPPTAAPKTPEAAPSAPAPPPGPVPRQAAVAAKLKLSPKEFEAFQGLVDQGYEPQQVLKAIEGQRAAQALQQRLGTPTTAEVDAAVADRNATGRWPQDRR